MALAIVFGSEIVPGNLLLSHVIFLDGAFPTLAFPRLQQSQHQSFDYNWYHCTAP